MNTLPLFLCILLLAAPAQAPTVLAIVGSTLIDGTGRAPIPDAVILVEAARISRLGPRATTQARPR